VQYELDAVTEPRVQEHLACGNARYRVVLDR